MNPELGDGSASRLDEKIAVTVALALGIPLALVIFGWRGLIPWSGSGVELPEKGAANGMPASPSPQGTSPFSAMEKGGLTGTRAPAKAAGGGEERSASGNREFKAEVELPRTGRKTLLGETGPGAPVKGGAGEAQAEVEFLRGEQERMRARNQELEKEAQNLREEFAGAKRLHAQLVRDSLDREQRQAEALRSLQADLRRSVAEAEQLKAGLETLRGEAAGLRQQAEELKKVQAALEGEKKKSGDLTEAFKRAQGEQAALKARVDAMTAGAKTEGNAAMQSLKASNAALQSEVEELRKKLKEVEAREAAGATASPRSSSRAKPGSPAGPPPLKARVIESSPPAGDLPAEVREPEDLWNGAVPLYGYLRQAAEEKVRVTERDETAQSKNMGRLVARVSFGNNQHRLAPAEEKRLQGLLAQQVDAGYFLVVGYASLPGCHRQNEALSRRRAEAVAEMVKEHLKGGARLQTIYFGETDQFDPEREEKNRVVEIWRVGS